MLPKISAKIAGMSSFLCALLMLFAIVGLSFYTYNFQLFGSWLSDLGTGNYGTLFNSILAISALLLVPFGTYLYRELGRKEYIRIIFLLTAFFLVLLGIFDGNFYLHKPVAYIFFGLSALSMLIIGYNFRSTFGNITIIIIIWCMAGILFLNPLIETIQALVAIAWLFAAGAYVFTGRLTKVK
ncbi:MAG: DUF998 domain-containing protein [Candidatus Aenigmarchaeota archaeon]|nr:DUF998 domain-containing protein [Candidatus Aenigmarchaeota archaeon]